MVLGLGADQCAAQPVGVAVEKLGGGVHDDVSAERKRALQGGRHEGVVDADFHAPRMGDLAYGGNVGENHQRIGGSFDVHEFGVGPDGRSDGVKVAHVDVLDFNSIISDDEVEEARGSTVDIV